MKITVLTLFPEFFQTPLESSILSRAQKKSLVEFELINIRDFATDKHKTADDHPFGGGPGMVMKIEPIYAALQKLYVTQKPEDLVGKLPGNKIVLTSAKGQKFMQQTAQAYSKLEQLTIICGHYEGVDERVAEHLVDEEVRIGDYVLTGGEPAALVMLDAVTRLIPNALGNEASSLDESHTKVNQLEYPHYTRPETFNGWSIPEVLKQGHHQQISDWRISQQKTAE